MFVFSKQLNTRPLHTATPVSAVCLRASRSPFTSLYAFKCLVLVLSRGRARVAHVCVCARACACVCVCARARAPLACSRCKSHRANSGFCTYDAPWSTHLWETINPARYRLVLPAPPRRTSTSTSSGNTAALTQTWILTNLRLCGLYSWILAVGYSWWSV